jgi:hypothetical protein
MTDRVFMARGTASVRVVREDVGRFKAMGYSEPAPAPKSPARKRRTAKAGGE